MKNNFDLKGYMKQNQVGSYQQLNEMWYQDINQALGDFNEAKVITEEEMELEEAKKPTFVIPAPDAYDIDEEAEFFQNLLSKAGVQAVVKGDVFDEEVKVYTNDEAKARKVIEKSGYQIGWNEDNLEEMGGVKNIGDKAKMATPNTRPNLGRHRSSDTLDKQVAKDHDKKTVVGAKAAAYKAPHMKEDEDVFAGSEDADWDNRSGGDYWMRDTEWEKNIPGKEISGWKADIEQQAGSLVWENPKYPNALIYATPGWEGVNGIAVEVHESEDGYLEDPILQKVVGVGTDKWKTEEGYMALMAKILPVIEKMLTPAEMAEDHGTAVDHDMNDNISKDHSEFEDTVYEEENPFDAIKSGIDNITQGDEEDIDDNRIMSMGGDQIKAGIQSLLDDGFDYRQILELVKDAIKSSRKGGVN